MKHRIIIADDDNEFRKECKAALDTFEVLEAKDGNEALEILRKSHNLDLMILDIKMPGKEGLEVLHDIRRLDDHIGIIMITAYGSKETVLEALKGRADDFIEKPVDMERLINVINRILTQRKGGMVGKGTGIRSKIERVKHYLKKNYYKKISLIDAAEAVCLSPKYLSRIFKQKTGKGFIEYKLEMKLDKAKMLLRQTENTVEQISQDLAYENTESFIRAFKKFTGTTPTEFRQGTNRVKSPSRSKAAIKVE